VANPAQVASAPIDIVIADDHAMVRAGLRLLLEADPGLRVVAEAGDVDGALEQTRTHGPAVVLLDLNMPGTRTLPAIPRFF
jgi:two-component system, NarL family, response regulator NreC